MVSTASLQRFASCMPMIILDCASLWWINLLLSQVGIQSPAF